MRDLLRNGEMVLEGEVLSHEWCEMLDGQGCFSAQMVRDALGRASGDVRVRVNSIGGDADEGEAIRLALLQHTGRITVAVEGLAASAASLLIMAADRIEIGAASFIMIHNPSAGIFGTAEDHRAAATTLDTRGQAYAEVYAARAGLEVDEVAAMMAAETYLSAGAAIEMGFADAVIGEGREAAPAEMRAHVVTMADQARARLTHALQNSTAAGVIPVVKPTEQKGQNPAAAMAALSLEVPQMSDNQNQVAEPSVTFQSSRTVTAPEAVAPVDPAPAPAEPAAQMAAPGEDALEAARAAERARISDIREIAQPYMISGRLSDAAVQGAIDAGLTPERASMRFMQELAAGEATGGASMRITRDETETQIEGMISALMRDFDGPGAQFRGLRLRGLATHLAGGEARDFNLSRTVARGMRSTALMGGAHGVSDFAYITSEVMGRNLMREYERRAATWQAVTGAPISAADFREQHAVRFGGDFTLKKVLENGEYEESTLGDQAEGLKVEKRGRRIKITFEAVINDDMGAFQRIPREFAMAARMMENSMVWALFRTNAKLSSDNLALFHSTHKNIGTAGALSVTTIGEARRLMYQQKAYASKSDDDFLAIEPDTLIVPPALDLAARQVTTAVTPASASDVNPYGGGLTPVVVPNIGAEAGSGGSDTAYYLVSSDLPPIAAALLDGYEAPSVTTLEGGDPDEVVMRARHVFGAAPVEFRGAVKNAGA